MVGPDPRHGARFAVPARLRGRARRTARATTERRDPARNPTVGTPDRCRGDLDGRTGMAHGAHRQRRGVPVVPRRRGQPEVDPAGQPEHRAVARLRHGVERAHRLDEPDPGDGRSVHRHLLRRFAGPEQPAAPHRDDSVHSGVRIRRHRWPVRCADHQGRTGALTSQGVHMTTTPLTPADRTPEQPSAVPASHEAASPVRGEGPAAAALLGAGVGAFVLGLLTTLAEASTSIKDSLTLSDSVGPLSGKTTYAVVVWLVAWAVLHFTVGRRARLTTQVLTVVVVLFGLGLLGTFPIFFQLFAAE